MKDIEALLMEYKRLAPFGNLVLLRGGPGQAPGGLSNLTLQDIRIRDVHCILQEYRQLHALAYG
jgi:hypothetical protein